MAERFHVENFRMPNPPGSKRVMRPSRWGNPFRVGIKAATAAEAVAMFRTHLQGNPGLVELGRRELAGFDLGCTCPLDQPCHADVWLELVNSGATLTTDRPRQCTTPHQRLTSMRSGPNTGRVARNSSTSWPATST